MFLLLLGLFITSICCTSVDNDIEHKSRLIVLFLDGLRWDYLQNASLTGMQQLSTFGSIVPSLKPIFPSDCHANMHAIFAGRKQSHPEFFSENFKPNFSSSDLLWHAAARQGKHVQLYHFSFCEEPDQFSEHLKPPNLQCEPSPVEAQSLSATMQQVLSDMESKSVDFAGVYYGELDRVAHLYGPSSPQLRSGPIAEVDAAVAFTLEALLGRPTLFNVNLVILADHGMTEFKEFIYLDRLFQWELVERTVNLGTNVALWPNPNTEEDLLEILSLVPHTRLFTHSSWPETEWGPAPPPPVLLVADAGFAFESTQHQPARQHILRPADNPRGHHGYPPDVVDMHTALYAFGPAFLPRSLTTVGIISTTDVHPMFTRLLGLSSSLATESHESTGISIADLVLGLREPKFVYLLVVLGCLLFCSFVAATCFLLRRTRGYTPQINLDDKDENDEEKI